MTREFFTPHVIIDVDLIGPSSSKVLKVDISKELKFLLPNASAGGRDAALRLQPDLPEVQLHRPSITIGSYTIPKAPVRILSGS